MTRKIYSGHQLAMSRFKIKRRASSFSRMRKRRELSLLLLRQNQITCWLLMRSMRCLSSIRPSRRLKSVATPQQTKTKRSSALAKARLLSSKTYASSCSSQILAAVRGSANVSTQVNWLTSHTNSPMVVPTTWLRTPPIRNCWNKSTEEKVSHLSASYPSKMRSLKQCQQRVIQAALTVSHKAKKLVWTILSRPRQLNMLSSLSSLVTKILIKSSTACLKIQWSKP